MCGYALFFFEHPDRALEMGRAGYSEVSPARIYPAASVACAGNAE